jgi:hypothetical protein
MSILLLSWFGCVLKRAHKVNGRCIESFSHVRISCTAVTMSKYRVVIGDGGRGSLHECFTS